MTAVDRQLNRIESLVANAYGLLAEVRDLILDTTAAELVAVTTLKENTMANLDALAAEIETNTDAVDSVVTLLDRLADELANVDPADQTAIDAFVADLHANSQMLADAVVRDTPAEPGTGPTGPTEPTPTEPGTGPGVA